MTRILLCIAFSMLATCAGSIAARPVGPVAQGEFANKWRGPIFRVGESETAFPGYTILFEHYDGRLFGVLNLVGWEHNFFSGTRSRRGWRGVWRTYERLDTGIPVSITIVRDAGNNGTWVFDFSPPIGRYVGNLKSDR